MSGGDWVKMRVLLGKDPKVIAMAAKLRRCPAFLAWATCAENGTVSLPAARAAVVSGLLVLWGVARDQGGQSADADGRPADDLRLSHADLDALDAISETPGLGAAMAAVGWARQEEGSVVLPHFFRQNPETRKLEERRRKDRERKRASRAAEREAKAEPITPDAADCPRTVRGLSAAVAGSPPPEERRGEEIRKKEEPPQPPKGGGGLFDLARENDRPQKTESAPDASPYPKGKAPRPPSGEWDGTLPAALDVPELRAAWEKWERYRRETRHPLKPTTREMQWKRLTELGVPQAVAMIEHTIFKGWQGLREPDEPPGPAGRSGGGGGGNGAHHDPDAKQAARSARIAALHAKLGIPTS